MQRQPRASVWFCSKKLCEVGSTNLSFFEFLILVSCTMFFLLCSVISLLMLFSSALINSDVGVDALGMSFFILIKSVAN